MQHEPLEAQAWRKSSWSAGEDACVELAAESGVVMVRDSKDIEGGVLTFTASEFAVALDAIKAGLYDLPEQI